MTVGSLFAGIGGFDLGFERAGFETVWQVEREPVCVKVLAQHWPTVHRFDDVCTVGAHNLTPVDVIVAGVPCQDVSIAGKRAGLHGDRTGLFFEFARIVRELQPRWVVMENVPGLLSSNGGRDFHTVLATLAECGLRRAYRILDSRYFGVAQRRRRVFIVLRARRCGDGAETVLFESESGCGDSQAGAETLARVVATVRGRSHSPGVNMPGRGGEDDENLAVIAGPLGGGNDGIGRRTEDDTLISIASTLDGQFDRGPRGDGSDNLIAFGLGSHAGAADGDQTNRSHASGGPVGMGISEELSHSLRAGRAPSVGGQASGVRRLTPLECERLQGFPDGFTCLCGEGHRGSRFCTCSDSPRYRALGNAVSVPVAEWIARRMLAAGLTAS